MNSTPYTRTDYVFEYARLIQNLHPFQSWTRRRRHQYGIFHRGGDVEGLPVEQGSQEGHGDGETLVFYRHCKFITGTKAGWIDWRYDNIGGIQIDETLVITMAGTIIDSAII